MTRPIRIIAQTAETVTIGKGDYDVLIQAAEGKEDLAALAAHDAEEERLGRHVARGNHLTADEAERLPEGESAIVVWREKRRLTQRTLAKAAGIQPGYLAEIETGKKPGSAAALLRISTILGVSMTDLLTRDRKMREPDHGPVLLKGLLINKQIAILAV